MAAEGSTEGDRSLDSAGLAGFESGGMDARAEGSSETWREGVEATRAGSGVLAAMTGSREKEAATEAAATEWLIINGIYSASAVNGLCRHNPKYQARSLLYSRCYSRKTSIDCPASLSGPAIIHRFAR